MNFFENNAVVGVLILVAWLCGRAARRLGQPAVIGELAAGIAIGPSVFGALAPRASTILFDPAVAAGIFQLAQIAVLTFMFFVGCELDVALLQHHVKGVARIAAFSLVVPFTLGASLATALYANFHGPVANRTAFILFGGTAMAITAMPVLTRILTDMQLLGTRIGTIAVGCSAIDDVVAWLMLGFVTGLVQGQATGVAGVALLAAYAVVMLFVIRPALARLELSSGPAMRRMLWPMIVILTTALSAWATERIGIHSVFGALMAGVCMPRTSDALRGLGPVRRLSAILLPAFFVQVGLQTQIGLMSGAEKWIVTSVIILFATAGKLGGATLASWTLGFAWRDSLAIGSLLNTRGLVELVALNIGRMLGIISPVLFTMFVIMTFVTTFATVPLIQLLRTNKEKC